MNVRLLTFLLTVAAALWAMAPAAAAQGGSEEPAAGVKAPVKEPKYTLPSAPPAAPEEQQQQPPSAPLDQTSTSPGGQAPDPGTATTGPGVPASTCSTPAALRDALRSLRRAARGRNVLSRRARAFGVRLRPCAAGTVVLTIAEERSGLVLWRAERVLRTALPATLRMTMTRAGRRFVARARGGKARRVALRVRATYAPASSKASTSPSTS